jgi:hypothetical protein
MFEQVHPRMFDDVPWTDVVMPWTDFAQRRKPAV